jgi:hypothetical protein
MPELGGAILVCLVLVRLGLCGAWLWGKADKGSDNLQTKPLFLNGFGAKTDNSGAGSPVQGEAGTVIAFTGQSVTFKLLNTRQSRQIVR